MNPLTIYFLMILAGVIFALLAFIPPIRQFARRSARNRFGAILSLTIFTIIVCLLIIAFLSQSLATVSYELLDINCGFPPPTTEEEREVCARQHKYFDYKDEIVDKLTMQYVFPPPLRQPCISDNSEICDAIESATFDISWVNLIVLVVSCISCASLALFITRPSHTQ